MPSALVSQIPKILHILLQRSAFVEMAEKEKVLPVVKIESKSFNNLINTKFLIKFTSHLACLLDAKY